MTIWEIMLNTFIDLFDYKVYLMVTVVVVGAIWLLVHFAYWLWRWVDDADPVFSGFCDMDAEEVWLCLIGWMFLGIALSLLWPILLAAGIFISPFLCLRFLRRGQKKVNKLLEVAHEHKDTEHQKVKIDEWRAHP